MNSVIRFMLSLSSLFWAQISLATCTDMVLNLQETEQSKTISECKGGCRAVLSLRCMGGTMAIPGSTLVQIIRERDGKLCYSDHVCGETQSWAGYIGLSGTWVFYNSVISFVASDEGQQALSANRDFNGQTSAASIALEWGQIVRSCKSVSPEICM
jgi:hypothetical protein